MEIPQSWGLSVEQRADGSKAIMGVDASGEKYEARKLDAAEPSEDDVKALYLGHPDRQDHAAFMGHIQGNIDARERRWENSLNDEWAEAGDRVAVAACPSTKIGYGRRYGYGFEKIDWRS